MSDFSKLKQHPNWTWALAIAQEQLVFVRARTFTDADALEFLASMLMCARQEGVFEGINRVAGVQGSA